MRRTSGTTHLIATCAVALCACGSPQRSPGPSPVVETDSATEAHAGPSWEFNPEAVALLAQAARAEGVWQFRPDGPWTSPLSGTVFPETAGNLSRRFVGVQAVQTLDVVVRYESPAGCRVSLIVFLPYDLQPPNADSVITYTLAALQDIADVYTLVGAPTAFTVGEGAQQYGVGLVNSAREDGGENAELVVVAADATWLYKARMTAASDDTGCADDALSLVAEVFPSSTGTLAPPEPAPVRPTLKRPKTEQAPARRDARLAP